MRNDGLSTANFLSGAMEGYQFMSGVDQNKKNEARADRQEGQQNELHGLRMNGERQRQEEDAIRVSQMSQEHEQNMNKTIARQMLYGRDSPNLDHKFISKYPNLDVGRLTSDEAGKHLDTIHKTLSSGGDIESFNTPEMMETLNFLNPEVALGAKDGRKVKIRSIHAGTRPGYVMFGLDVEGDDSPNGRPLTENRSADPKDKVKEVSINDLLGRAEGFEGYRNMALDPKQRDAFIKFHLGDELASREEQLADKKSKRSMVAADITLKNAQANYYNTGKGGGGSAGGGSGSTANMKDIEYFKSLGYDDQDAVDLVINRGASPSQEITRMAVEMVKGTQDADTPIAMEEAMDRSKAWYNANMRKVIKPKGQSPAQPTTQPAPVQKQAPQAAIDALAADPKLADQFQAKFGYLPQ